jgi:hypothetical protein
MRRNGLNHANKSQYFVVAATIATLLTQHDLYAFEEFL